jgi:hypothetical protein
MLSDAYTEHLKAANIAQSRFSRIACELLGRGTIYRNANETHQRLYDDALRIKDALIEFWTLIGFRLLHDERTAYFQLFPPGAEVPGVQNDDEYEADAAVRRRVGPDLAALIILLRFLFDQKLTQGEIYGDEVPITIEEISVAMKSHLKRDLPAGAVERERLLRELRLRKLVRYGENAQISGSDGRIAILPTILTVVSRDVCASVVDSLKASPITQDPSAPSEATEDEEEDS